jgi:hypothetical protein
VEWQISPGGAYLTLNADEQSQAEVQADINSNVDCHGEARISLLFEGVVFCALVQKEICDDSFDWSLIPLASDMHQKWKESKFCPDPRVYEVRNTDLSPYTINTGFTKWLIMGTDAYAEVVALKLKEITYI